MDELQVYPHLLTLVKFLIQDGRFQYIASGSLLGVTLAQTQSIPIGSIRELQMYPLDFEEFLYANNFGKEALSEVERCFKDTDTLSEAIHGRLMNLLRKYLLVGGFPQCVNSFIAENNIYRVREIQAEIHNLYFRDAAKYERESLRRLKLHRIYEMLPSNLENKKKRIVAKDVENVKGRRMADYEDEFEYLISSGIALEVKAISQPSYPLAQNSGKNLLKLYLNDVGLFTGILFKNNIQPILNDELSINLGAVYENLVAQELKSHGFDLYYYDNKKNGEVDYLIDDSSTLSVLPIEVKSGKDYTIHSALNRFLGVANYNINSAIVFSNERRAYSEGGIRYLPIYDVMFLKP